MIVLFRCRVKKPLLDKANKVTRDLGTSTPEMVRIFLTQIAKTGKVPLKLDPEPGTEDPIAGPLEYRAALLESFYDKSKTWYSRTAPSVNSEDCHLCLCLCQAGQ